MNNPNYAVRFGDDVARGLETKNKTFPFIYNFVDIEKDTWDSSKSTNPLQHIGPTVPAGGTVNWPIRLRPDHAYLEVWIKYTCYYNYTSTAAALTGTLEVDAAGAITGTGTAFLTELIPGDTITDGTETLYIQSITNNTTAQAYYAPTAAVPAGTTFNRLARSEYHWYNDSFLGTTPPGQGWILEQGDYQLAIGTPLSHYIEVSFIDVDNSTVVYGDEDFRANSAGNIDRLPLDVIQGYEYGYGQLYSPRLFPRQGIAKIQIENLHPTKAITVGGMLYGRKVRL